MSKGDWRRPHAVSAEHVRNEYDRIFGKKESDEFPSAPSFIEHRDTGDETGSAREAWTPVSLRPYAKAVLGELSKPSPLAHLLDEAQP